VVTLSFALKVRKEQRALASATAARPLLVMG
jgi:hypothetical protein